MKKRVKNKVVIYDDNGWDFDDAKQDLIESSDPETNGVFEEEYNPSDDEVWDHINFCQEIWWDDAKRELEPFIEKHAPFVLTGSAGLWTGRAAGGYIVEDWNDFCKGFSNGDYQVCIYDEGGVLCMDCAHHDGTNYWELYELTEKGKDYLSRHYWDDRQDLVESLLVSGRSKLPRFAQKIYGSPLYESKRRQNKRK